MDKKTKIVVICGGTSTEREVSLKSGHAIFEGLRNAGFRNVSLFDLNSNNIREIFLQKIDLAFLALHGKDGEDGRIQGLLELAGIPYTGPGVQSSVLCMNKILTKIMLNKSNIPSAEYLVIREEEMENYNCVEEQILNCIGIPAVVKAPSQGSSIGVSIVKSIEKLKGALTESFRYDDTIMVEKYIEGIEVTIPILGNEQLSMLPIVEIVSENDFYDFSAKYTSGLCHHIIPARISEADERRIQELGEVTYRALGCTGFSRIDFIIDKIEGPKVVEVNTIPGMTEMSLVPDSAKSMGMSFEKLVTLLAELGMNTNR